MNEDQSTDRPTPLSVNQDSYLFGEWVGHLRSEDPPPFIGWCGVDFASEPDVERLEQALTRVVDRHEVLRTEFTDVSAIDRANSPTVFAQFKQLTIGSSLFSRRVCPRAPVTISVAPVARLQLDKTARSVDTDAIASDLNRPFKYDAPPLLRATLVKPQSDLWFLSLTLHHLVCDRWSLRVLRRELAAHYQSLSQPGRAAVPSPARPMQYSDFSLWQRRELEHQWEEGLSYWRQVWTEYIPALMTFGDIPYAAPAAPMLAAVETHVETVVVDRQMSHDVTAFCRQQGITPYAAWLAAMLVVCRLYSQRDRISLMSYQANRTRPEWADLIGWFTNTYVCGVTVAGTADGQSVVNDVRRRVVDASRHQTIPMGFVWSRLIREGVLEKRFSIPEWVSFDFVRVRQEGNVPWRNVWANVVGRHTKPELAVVVVENDHGFTLTCRYPAIRFSPSAVVHVLEDLQSVMHRLMTSPTEPVERYQNSLALR